MKLNLSEYRWILLNCNLILGQYKGKQYVIIEPKYPKYARRLETILGKSMFPTLEEWNKFSRSLNLKRKEDDCLHHDMAERKLSAMSLEKIALLNNKQRLELLDSLLVDVIGNDSTAFDMNCKTIKNNHEKIKALLKGINLPQEFVEQEQARCDHFCHRLQSVPHLAEYFEIWSGLDFSKKKDFIENILSVFNDCYQTDIKLDFFNEDEWGQEQKHKHKSLSASEFSLPLAYQKNNTIFINKEKFSVCDNFVLLSVVYHEGLHILQTREDWSNFPSIEKLFEQKFSDLAQEQKDLYMINPLETHTYDLNNRVADFLKEKMQIKFLRQ